MFLAAGQALRDNHRSMFSFFKKKPAPPPAPAPFVAPLPAAPSPVAAPWPEAAASPPSDDLPSAPPLPDMPAAQQPPAPAAAPAEAGSWWKQAVGKLTGGAKAVEVAAPALPAAPTASSAATPPAAPAVAPSPAPAAPPPAAVVAALSTFTGRIDPPAPVALPAPAAPAPRQSWLDKLRNGLRKTGSSIAQVFTGTQIDDALYEELEAALLMADTGVKATEFLLTDLKRRVKDARATDPALVKGLLADALAQLLAPLEKPLEVGRHEPTVMMVVGVNGAGKTTSIGKLTKHLADAEQTVLLAAADTFRAAAREQLAVWADRNRVEIISNEGADPAAVAFDAVAAGKARKRDVVIADTAGRLPTQLHLMEELKKIQRVIAKADPGAPHEVLLVVDGNTGQNALAQVKSFDDALGLTGLIVTKLDGTAKGGVLAAIARERPIPVYFIGVGEKLEDLQTFDAREFAQALLN
jgi:fused signal recognition particle receptor